ncbi:MAG: PAS domain S-box protein, partial [Candidatus Omnitrophica bacterium]|nr:PAS domain S-box protein [Candidatus Omnitrophota bacterium]
MSGEFSEEQYRIEAQKRYQAVFDQMYQFTGLMTPDGTLIEVNRTALDFAGVKREDVIDQLYWLTPWWRHSKEVQGRIREAVKSAAEGEFIRFETTVS